MNNTNFIFKTTLLATFALLNACVSSTYVTPHHAYAHNLKKSGDMEVAGIVGVSSHDVIFGANAAVALTDSIALSAKADADPIATLGDRPHLTTQRAGGELTLGLFHTLKLGNSPALFRINADLGGGAGWARGYIDDGRNGISGMPSRVRSEGIYGHAVLQLSTGLSFKHFYQALGLRSVVTFAKPTLSTVVNNTGLSEEAFLASYPTQGTFVAFEVFGQSRYTFDAFFLQLSASLMIPASKDLVLGISLADNNSNASGTANLQYTLALGFGAAFDL